MNDQSTPWLPPANPADVEALLTKFSASWLTDWFAGSRAAHAGPATRSALRQLAWFGDAEVQIGCESAAQARLGQVLCGGLGDGTNPVDTQVLAEVAARACTDLAGRLGAQNTGQEECAAGPVSPTLENCLALAPADRSWTLAIVLSQGALNRLRQRSARSGKVPDLGSMAKALAGEPCRLGLQFGVTSLSAAELAQLEVGDVIAFSSKTDAALPMVVEGHRAKQGAASLTQVDEGLLVTMTAPVSRDVQGVER
jgi:flagellar motor switch/type III secretory pathway protein FliN